MMPSIEYFAGLIDGEGCIHVAKRPDRTNGMKQTVEVNMTDETVIRLLQKEFGGTVWFKGRGKPHYQDQWRWRVTHKDARACVKRLLPHLIVKRAAAEHLLAYSAQTYTAQKRGRPRKATPV